MAAIIKLQWENPVSQERTELVFANRFKEYGAYTIRKSNEKTTAAALLISIAFFSFCACAPSIVSMLFEGNNDAIKKRIEIDLTPIDPPLIDENKMPPLPTPTQPHQIETVKFTPPVVVDRTVVEDQPPPQEILIKTSVGTVTQTGEKVEGPLPVVVEDPDDNEIRANVQEMPLFPGGEDAFVKYLNSVPYPAMARENNISGRVFVYFVIEKDGSVSDVKIQHGVGAGGLDEAAVNWIKKMPKWSPGKQDGRPARVQYIVPFSFSLK